MGWVYSPHCGARRIGKTFAAFLSAGDTLLSSDHLTTREGDPLPWSVGCCAALELLE